jgi:hypothetical protein
MTLSLLRFAIAVEVLAVFLAAGAEQVQVPTDVLKTCKNEVGARYLNVPMAYINVDRGSKTANGNYLVNWTTKPPGGAGSVGFCVVDSSFYVLRFETTSGPQPGIGNAANVSPEDALRACKNEVADRLRTVPMAEITVERTSDAADGSYVINWRAQRPGGVKWSGFCNITPDGKIRDFHFDAPPAKPPGGGT